MMGGADNVRVLWAAMLGFLVLFLPEAAPARTGDNVCLSADVLPFAGGEIAATQWRTLVREEGFCILIGDRATDLGDRIPLAVVESGGSYLVFSRRKVSSFLAVTAIAPDGGAGDVDLEFDQRSKLHLEAAFPLDGKAYALAYDVAYNLPSGRRREVPRQVISFHRVATADDGLKLEAITEPHFNAGIEAGVLVDRKADRAWICAGVHCMRVAHDTNGNLTADRDFTIALENGGAEILELASDEDADKAAVLVQLTVDDRFQPMPAADQPAHFLCSLSDAVECRALDPLAIPYNLRMVNGDHVVDEIRQGDEPAGLLLRDLSRSGINGMANFGENNLEGRIAWSQAYYLNGLLSAMELGGALGLTAEEQDAISRRFVLEVEQMATIASLPYPGFMVKRYSLDREPYASLLHNARILKPVLRGQSLLSPQTIGRFAAVEGALISAEDAIEDFSIKGQGGHYEGYIRKYFPFWADGGRTPWNFQSGWIETIALAPRRSERAITIAASMARDFIEKSGLGELPETWIYTSGNTLEGWSEKDGVSSNTPDYDGDTANPNGAHISYRSMDALGLLAAARAGIIGEEEIFTNHLASLVSSGRLYPFVNEELALRTAVAPLPFHVARHYARSRLPWAIQNQPWALKAIVADAK